MRVGEEISKEKRKTKRRKKREIEKEKEKKGKENEDPKASSSDLPAFRLLEFVGLRVNVHLLHEGYAPRGMDSFYFGLFPP